ASLSLSSAAVVSVTDAAVDKSDGLHRNRMIGKKKPSFNRLRTMCTTCRQPVEEPYPTSGKRPPLSTPPARVRPRTRSISPLPRTLSTGDPREKRALGRTKFNVPRDDAPRKRTAASKPSLARSASEGAGVLVIQ